MELSEELQALKQQWRKRGFLLPGVNWDKSFEFSLFGRFVLIGLGRSGSGYWDDYSATGSVYTNGLTFRKCRQLDRDSQILTINQAIIGKFIISVATIKDNCDSK